MKKESGFGIIEVIVSLSIMAMVILAMVSLSTLAFFSWEDSQNRAIAQGIIQDTIESIHNKRDSNVIDGKIWCDSIRDGDFSNNSIIINNRRFSSEVKIMELSSGSVVCAQSDTKKRVIVDVKWKERLGDKDLQSITYVTDWRSKY